jgi:hypothetical protein
VQVGDLVRGRDGATGVVTHMANHLGVGHAWVYVTVSWADTGPHLEKSCDLEVVNESR